MGHMRGYLDVADTAIEAIILQQTRTLRLELPNALYIHCIINWGPYLLCTPVSLSGFRASNSESERLLS